MKMAQTSEYKEREACPPVLFGLILTEAQSLAIISPGLTLLRVACRNMESCT